MSCLIIERRRRHRDTRDPVDSDVALAAEKRLRRKSETDPRCSFYDARKRDVTLRDIRPMLLKLLNVAREGLEGALRRRRRRDDIELAP